MNKFKHLMLVGVLAAASTTASAGVIDFVSLIEDPATGLGESAWNSLNVSDPLSGVSMTLTAGYVDSNDVEHSAFVYLDWKNAGVGVCRELDSGSPKSVDTAYNNNGANLCNPASDDNVTGVENDWGEFLDITFDQAANITFTLNNNHDNGFDMYDYAWFDGLDAYASGDFINFEMDVSAGQTVRVAFGNEQFYLESIAVPEPAMFSLLGLGLLGFGFARRARKKA